jgi:16S rRNA (guanine527-N7)-methyltransferase
MTLIEPLLRRSKFLTHTVENLGITDTVRVVRSRAEDHHDAYDAVLSRALAPLDRLIPWCNPLRSPAGVILALKGRSAQEEVDSSAAVLAQQRLRADVLVVRATPSAEPTTVVRLTGR